MRGPLDRPDVQGGWAGVFDLWGADVGHGSAGILIGVVNPRPEDAGVEFKLIQNMMTHKGPAMTGCYIRRRERGNKIVAAARAGLALRENVVKSSVSEFAETEHL